MGSHRLANNGSTQDKYTNAGRHRAQLGQPFASVVRASVHEEMVLTLRLLLDH